MRIRGTIITVVSHVFLCIIFIGCGGEKTKLQQFTTSDDIDVLVEYTDQGAYGSYVNISLRGDSIDENFFLRSEDAIPSVDSIVNNKIHIHYKNFPSKDSILNPQLVLLGESLFQTESKFTLDLTNKR